MCTICATCAVKMSSIGDMLRFDGNSKVYKCSLSRKSSVTLMSGVGFG